MGTYLDDQRREAGATANNLPDAVDVNTLADEQRTIFDKYVTACTKILAGERVP
jgi:hypothetical protein